VALGRRRDQADRDNRAAMYRTPKMVASRLMKAL
jgi:hypothetical protein